MKAMLMGLFCCFCSTLSCLVVDLRRDKLFNLPMVVFCSALPSVGFEEVAVDVEEPSSSRLLRLELSLLFGEGDREEEGVELFDFGAMELKLCRSCWRDVSEEDR